MPALVSGYTYCDPCATKKGWHADNVFTKGVKFVAVDALANDRIIQCGSCNQPVGNPVLSRTIERFFERIRDHEQAFIRRVAKVYKLDIGPCGGCSYMAEVEGMGSCTVCCKALCNGCGWTCRCGKRFCANDAYVCDYGMRACSEACHREHCPHNSNMARVGSEFRRANGKPVYTFVSDDKEV